MRVYLPPIGAKLALTKDGNLADFGNSWYHDDLERKLFDLRPYNEDNQVYTKIQENRIHNREALTIPSGTIVQVVRYHLGQSDDRISLKVVESLGQPKLKKQKLYPTVQAFNDLEMVVVTV